MPFEQVAGLASRRTYALTSSFHPTYNMAANLVQRYPPQQARHLLNLSFAQFHADRDVVAVERDLELRRAQLAEAEAAAVHPACDVDEYRRLRSLTDAPVKVPVPGPFTLAGCIQGGDVYKDRDEITEALWPIVNHEMLELVKAGVILAGDGLQPTSKGKRVKFSGSKCTVTDGPFTETKELIAGYGIWQVRSIDEAVEWVKRAPFDGGTEVEIRPVYEANDFGENLTPELRERGQRLRGQITAKK